jgi:hypothetical protein
VLELEGDDEQPTAARTLNAKMVRYIGGRHGSRTVPTFALYSRESTTRPAGTNAPEGKNGTLTKPRARIGVLLVIARATLRGATQVHTDHLERFGAYEVPRARYLELLKIALDEPTRRGRWAFKLDLEQLEREPTSAA